MTTYETFRYTNPTEEIESKSPFSTELQPQSLTPIPPQPTQHNASRHIYIFTGAIAARRPPMERAAADPRANQHPGRRRRIFVPGNGQHESALHRDGAFRGATIGAAGRQRQRGESRGGNRLRWFQRAGAAEKEKRQVRDHPYLHPFFLRRKREELVGIAWVRMGFC